MPVLITVRLSLDSPLQPPRRIRRANWRSYHDDLHQTVPSDAPVTIASPADVDRMANYLQDIFTSGMDKHTYLVPDTNQRSQLPEEVLFAFRERRLLR